jgi:diguanylate cyclase (GGDEF)-like protein/PAS domain S-box-containing protein
MTFRTPAANVPFEPLLEGGAAIIFQTDAQGHLLYLNPAWTEITGFSVSDSLGLPFLDFLHEEDRAPAWDAFLTLAEGDVSRWHGEWRWLSHTGEAPCLETRLHPLWGDNRELLGTVGTLTAGPGGQGAEAALLREVTELRQQLTAQAHQDPLTGLMNRQGLQQALEQEHARPRGSGGFSLLLLDLDRFKVVNDNYGHATGDRALARMAEHLTGFFGPEDRLGRWGGEEFLAILPGTGPENANRLAERIRMDIESRPMEAGDHQFFVSASFGVASYPGCAADSRQLLQVADSRLYEAKRQGRNRVVDARQGDCGILTMAGKLQQALNEGGVAAAYQPMVSLADGAVVAEEALARLASPEGEILPAGQFIEAASQLQLVHRIDEQLMEATMDRCSRLVAAGSEVTHFVNISTDLLRHRERVDTLLGRAFRICQGCAPALPEEKPLVIEITEREFLEDPAEARRVLAPFLDYGFRLAVDDFGSGYSSFRYLADLPVSFLKIEGDLVGRALREPRIQAIIRGIRNIAGELNLTTIAEKVEDEETTQFLREVGIDWAQGFHFAYPRLESGENGTG